MHEIQTIVTDNLSVSLSVTRLSSASLCKNGWTDHDLVFGVNNFGDPQDSVLHGGPDLPTKKKEVGENFGQLRTNLKNGWN